MFNQDASNQITLKYKKDLYTDPSYVQQLVVISNNQQAR